jgi:hypothetical protein
VQLGVVSGRMRKHSLIWRLLLPGYEQQWQPADGLESIQRTYQVGERLYMLIVAYPQGQNPPPETQDFFDSFTLNE